MQDGPRNRLEPGLEMRVAREVRRIASQHRRLRELRKQVASALEGTRLDEAREVFAQLADALRAHFEVEEQVIFPAVCGLDHALVESVDLLLEDHQRLRAHIDRGVAHFTSGDGTAGARVLSALVEELETHERVEESVTTRARLPEGRTGGGSL